MIVVGVDVDKQSLTAVAVEEVGRTLAELTAAEDRDLLAWATSLTGERRWALEDCRQVTRPLERRLLAAGEQLVRVPPKLLAPQRRAGRERGKSDPIDALAVARAALREPRLDHPRPGEQRLRQLKLLLDHRDDLVNERRRGQQRLRWQLHDLDPALAIPAGALDRTGWLDRLARRLARGEQSVLVRIAPGAPRPLPQPHANDPRAGARAATTDERDRSGPARASWLWRDQRCQTARRDRPDRTLPNRRPTRPPRRRRTTRSQLRHPPPPPTRPRRQPPTQLRPPPNRDHPSAHAPARTRLPRAQTGRRKEPSRSPPLPQTTTRPHHLQHPQSQPRLDIGATLAQGGVGPPRPDTGSVRGFRSRS
jgi:hypothetical protein